MIFRQTNTIFFFQNYKLTTLEKYNGLSHIALNQKEESIGIQRVNIQRVYGKPLNGYFYSVDPDEMQHNVAFHQCLHC